MHGISVADVGAVVASIFNSPEQFLGKAVGLSAEALTVQQYADVLSKSLGKEVRDAKVSFLSFSFFPVLGIEPRATCVLGKHSTT
jgi:hypothetical protein